MFALRPAVHLRLNSAFVSFSPLLKSSPTCMTHQLVLKKFGSFSHSQAAPVSPLCQARRKSTSFAQSHRCYGSLAYKYLNPQNDWAFRRIFGAEKHKNIPIDFLNAALNLAEDDRIVDLEFLSLRQTPEIDARKESIVDVLVRDQKGIRYVVEMQVAKVKGFEKRAQYYAAKTYCAHFGVKGKYEDLKRVVFLAITDYEVFPNKKGYKSDHVILDKSSFEHDLRDFSFTFVELPKFTKTLDQLTSIEDQWYYFLKHADEGESIKEVLSRHSAIGEAYSVLERSRWSEEDLFFYEKTVMDEADMRGIIDAAHDDGKSKGKLEGRLEGKIEAIHQLALKLLQRKRPIEEIAELTGLSQEEIHRLARY